MEIDADDRRYLSLMYRSLLYPLPNIDGQSMVLSSPDGVFSRYIREASRLEAAVPPRSIALFEELAPEAGRYHCQGLALHMVCHTSPTSRQRPVSIARVFRPVIATVFSPPRA